MSCNCIAFELACVYDFFHAVFTAVKAQVFTTFACAALPIAYKINAV